MKRVKLSYEHELLGTGCRLPKSLKKRLLRTALDAEISSEALLALLVCDLLKADASQYLVGDVDQARRRLRLSGKIPRKAVPAQA